MEKIAKKLFFQRVEPRASLTKAVTVHFLMHVHRVQFRRAKQSTFPFLRCQS